MNALRVGAPLLALAVAGGCWVLYRWPPTPQSWYPGCLFAGLTGLDCPGCGTLRAMHALLHGDLAAAFGYNLLMTAALPVVALAAAWRLFNLFRTGRIGGHGWASRVAVPMLGVTVVFTLLRNLPIEQLRWMAP